MLVTVLSSLYDKFAYENFLLFSSLSREGNGGRQSSITTQTHIVSWWTFRWFHFPTTINNNILNIFAPAPSYRPVKTLWARVPIESMPKGISGTLRVYAADFTNHFQGHNGTWNLGQASPCWSSVSSFVKRRHKGWLVKAEVEIKGALRGKHSITRGCYGAQ